MRSESAHRRDYRTFSNEQPPVLENGQLDLDLGGLLDGPAVTPDKQQQHALGLDSREGVTAGLPLFSVRFSLTGRTARTRVQLLLTFLAGILATLLATSLEWPALEAFGLADSFDLPASASSLNQMGRTVELAGIHYYIPGKPKTQLKVQRPPLAWIKADLFPLTVLASSERALNEHHVEHAFDSYSRQDDVWTHAFTENVLLHYTGNTSATFTDKHRAYSNISFAVSGYSVRYGKKAVKAALIDQTLPSGPYFASVSDSGLISVYEAWRLYEDVARAFFYGTVPDTGDSASFRVLPASIPHTNGAAAIGVPSRLYYTKTDAQPLAGVRIAIKDSISVKGLKTSMASRAWLSLYPAATSTAPSIQRLVDMGGIIVGKTRLSQFATGAYGTADGVDYGVPHNLRGDGYQEPSSSSSGAGAAAGAYAWLDMSIGTDTGGSVRAPAAHNGAFGFRPSQGTLGMAGILPSSPSMDTIGLLGNDAKAFANYGRHLYGGNETLGKPAALPRQLLYLVDPHPEVGTPSPGFFPTLNSLAAPVFEAFVADLEGLLQTQRIEIDFYERFRQSFGVLPPEYIGKAWSLITAYDQWHGVGKQFISDYRTANGGHHPVVDPPVLQHWLHGQREVTEKQRHFWGRRKERFQRFIASELMDRNSTVTCSNAITVFPTNVGIPAYKSDYHVEGPLFEGWNRFSIAQLGQVPEVVIPIGQIPYFSKLTHTTKYLPVSISIQAAVGCDFVLFSLVEQLADAGIIRNPTPGHELTFA